ncbi:MAG: M48 family metalloprotease, partial [Verrucomicrobiota bacterium JB024]|nr:M48 family metalloprotease [Verrucomicrobiota bacterium JB024]
MATDFFERQDQARGKTALLVLYFVLTVLCIVTVLYLLGVVILNGALTRSGGMENFWDPSIFIWTTVVTVAVVGLSSVFKIRELGKGGGVVARSLGGKKLEPFTQNSGHRRLLNVVEEMAIASGTPVPEVYVLPENGINAFAAGFTPDDAAIAVTQGCIDNLSRDELQGVVAHEFSHILNGDMRLNIRLMGVIFGILVLAIIGQSVMGSLRHMRFSSTRSGKDAAAGAAVMLIVFLTGLALFVVGNIGVFFGRLIQSAVSRQREFLADASAVQFTRNPGGIAGALKRIGGLSYGSRINSPHAEEAAHLFFSSGVRSYLGGPFETHPPLEMRIRALEPGWDGRFVRTPYPWPDSALPGDSHPPPNAYAGELSYQRQPRRTYRKNEPLPPKLPPVDPMQMVFTVGTLEAAALDQARETRESLDAAFGSFLRSPLEARALLYALVLDADEKRRSQQLGYLQTEAGETIAQTTRELYPRVRQRPRSDTLPMIELALPALGQMEPEASGEFQQRLRQLVELDGKVTVFEFVVTRLVRRHLERRAAKSVKPGEYIWSA